MNLKYKDKEGKTNKQTNKQTNNEKRRQQNRPHYQNNFNI